MNNNKDKDRFEPMGTKISPAMAVVWNAVCDALGTDTYHLLQQFIYSMIRAASDQHAMTPEVRQLLDMLDLDAGWQNAINLCAPNGKLTISQMILIVEQEGKQGLGAVMLDKPFMGECHQTENVDAIYERLTEVIYKRHYLKLRKMGIDLGTRSVRETIDRMLEDQVKIELDDANREGPQMGDRTDSGRLANVYGKKTKGKQHRTPDSVANQQRIRFTDYDRETSEDEVKRDLNEEMSKGHAMDDDLESEMGFRPHGQEW